MTPYDLGQQLRALIQREHREGRPCEPQRLLAAVGDLCGASHAELVEPLRQLILSAAFASAAQQDPPLADARLLSRLESELALIYAAPVCNRVQPVLEGLLGLAPGSSRLSQAPGGAPLQPVVVPQAPAAPRSLGLNSALLLLCGLLLLALVGLAGLWLGQRQRIAVPLPSEPSSPAGGDLPPAPQSSERSSPPPPLAAPEDASPPAPALPQPQDTTAMRQAASPAGEAEARGRAIAAAQQLVEALARKDFSAAQPLIGSGASDQFEAGFYSQFADVSVGDLRVTGQRGSLVSLEGVMVFRWSDGSRQVESRSFSVDTGSDPPRIVASAFGRVLTPR
jgi:hypothetical protein